MGDTWKLYDLGKYGFKILLHKVEDPACGQHTVWVTQKIIK